MTEYRTQSARASAVSNITRCIKNLLEANEKLDNYTTNDILQFLIEYRKIIKAEMNPSEVV